MRLRALVSAAALVLTLAGPAHAAPAWRADQCRYRLLQPARPPAFTTREIELTMACAVQHWPVPGGVDRALAIARCESGLYPHAENGQYRGIFQMGTDEFATWKLRREGWHVPDDVFNARANIIAGVRYAHFAGWGPWSCA